MIIATKTLTANKASANSSNDGADAKKLISRFCEAAGHHWLERVDSSRSAVPAVTASALQRLERAYAQRDAGLTQMVGEPLLKNISVEPRFRAILHAMNLPD